MNKPARTTLINGIFADYISVDDRALHYGDGIFETLLCLDDKVFYWQQHYQRLQRSADRLKIHCPDEAQLLDDMKRLLASARPPAGKASAIKIILSRGAGERGYRYTDKIESNRLLMLSRVEHAYSSLLSRQLLAGELFLCETHVSSNQTLAGLKHLNRLENVLANNEWCNTSPHQYIDGVMLDDDRCVIEGTMSNIFMFKDNRLLTPDLQRSGVTGIMREQVLRVAASAGNAVSTGSLTIDDLSGADEVFITNSLIGLKSVTRFNDTDYGPSPLTRLIFDAILTSKEHYANTI